MGRLIVVTVDAWHKRTRPAGCHDLDHFRRRRDRLSRHPENALIWRP